MFAFLLFTKTPIMNLSIYKVTQDINLKTRGSRTTEFTEVKAGSHIVVVTSEVYVKRTTDSFCEELDVEVKFIQINPSIFVPVTIGTP